MKTETMENIYCCNCRRKMHTRPHIGSINKYTTGAKFCDSLCEKEHARWCQNEENNIWSGVERIEY